MVDQHDMPRIINTAPVPDPTVLTTESLRREVATLKELIEGKIEGRSNEVDARFNSMDKAIILLQNIADKMPLILDERVSHLETLMSQKFITVGEQFHGIETQFNERDVRVRDAALSQTTAVNAALQAQKEAAGEQVKSFEKSIDKSEAGTTKQIDGLIELLRTTGVSLNDKIDIATKGTDGKISDLKDRITTIEGLSLGKTTAVVDQRSGAGEIRAYIILGFVALAGILGLLGFILKP